MNKMILRLFLIVGVVVFTSCDSEDSTVIYDPLNDPMLLKYAQDEYDLAVVGAGDATIDIPVLSSTLSSSDRTFTITVDELQTTALPSQYSFDPNVVIPAGEHAGFLRVTAIESAIVNEVDVVFNLPESEEYSVDDRDVLVSLFVDCPLPDGYATGMYELFTTLPCEPGGCFGDGGTIVTLVDIGDKRRTFTANYLSQFGLGQADMTFEFELFCGLVNVADAQGTNLQCANGIQLGSAATPSTFDENDDSVITINFTDDVTDDCAPAGSAQAQITLIKV